MDVIKRSGKLVPFDVERIVKAVDAAMRETHIGIVDNLSRDIAQSIERLNKTMTVEEIQDEVERLLYLSRPDAAKKYMKYRDTQAQKRMNRKQYKLLDDDFISPYKKAENPMTNIGMFTFYRTYSRWIEEEGRREYWWETCRRAIEYNCSLAKCSKEEAQQLFHNMFYLKQFVAGRTLWIGGTEVTDNYALANFNCSGVVIDEMCKFTELFYLLMVGAGVGFRILPEDVIKLPDVRTDIKIIHQPYMELPKDRREDITSLTFKYGSAKIVVGDSKEGWVQALRFYLDILTKREYSTIGTILINYDNVRPRGERLKRFGGTASGHDSLQNMFTKIHKVISNLGIDTGSKYSKLKTINCLDIVNIIEENVVTGGVRRSAGIALIDKHDKECLSAKSGLYTQNESGEWGIDESIAHRSMSNNTTMYFQKPSREELKNHVQEMRYSGEPGFLNMEELIRRRPDSDKYTEFPYTTNPCQLSTSKVLTSKGYVEFKELQDSGTTTLYGKENKTTKMFPTGNKEVFEVELESGIITETTSNHVFITPRGNLRLDELNIGDSVCVDYTPVHSFEIKEQEDYEKGIIAGWVVADGWITNVIGLALGKDEFKYEDTLHSILCNHVSSEKYFKPHFQKPDTCKVIRYGSIEDKCKLKNILGINSDNKFDVTLDGKSREYKLGFIRAMFTCDGSSRSSGGASLYSNHIEFLRKIQRTLIEFGVFSNICIHNKERHYIGKDGKPRNNKNTYKIEVYDIEFLKIGYLTEYKNNSLKDSLNKESKRVLKRKETQKIKSISSIGFHDVYDITVDNVHQYNSNGFVLHNCGEVLLRDRGLCNLTSINVAGFESEGELDLEGLKNAMRLATRAGIRMTCVDLEMHEWDRVQKEDRLIGVSLTGWQDMVGALDYSIEDEEVLLAMLHGVVTLSINEYCTELGINKPKMSTTVKPDGSQSLLPTVSPGLHLAHSKYHIRRIRVNSNDPLVQVCEELGYPIFPEVGQDPETCKLKVVEFPVVSKSKKFKKDVTAVEQLETYKRFMKHYVEMNASITITVKDNEWDEVEEWLWNNWDCIVGVSFLSLSDSFYQLMPYEEITEEEYNRRVSECKRFDPELLKKYETKNEDKELSNDSGDCVGNACPIR